MVRKRLLSLLLVIAMIMPQCCINVYASGVLINNLTQGKVYDYTNLIVYWNGDSSATHYAFNILDLNADEKVEDAEILKEENYTSWYTDISNILNPGGKYKIWVGAFNSSNTLVSEHIIDYIYTAPTVETLSATGVDVDSFTMHGEVVGDHYDTYTFVGFEYGTSKTNTKTQMLGSYVSAGSQFKFTINNAKSSTKYYYRTVAKYFDTLIYEEGKEKITYYGDWETITTSDIPEGMEKPKVTTLACEELSSGAVRLKGKITDNGGGETTYGFVICIVADTVNVIKKITIDTTDSASKSFYYDIDSTMDFALDNYDYYAWAENDAGYSQGSYMEFDSPGSDVVDVENDRFGLSIGYATGDSQNSVTQNLTLPTVGLYKGSTITWKSSDTSVITNTGVVTRPSEDSTDKTVTLTATIKKGTASTTQAFTLKVLKKEGIPVISSLTPSVNTVSTCTPVTFTTQTKYTQYVAFYSGEYLLGVASGSDEVKYTLSDGFNSAGTKTIVAYPSDADGVISGESSASTTVIVTADKGKIPDFAITSPTSDKKAIANTDLTATWNAPVSGTVYYNLYLYKADDLYTPIYQKLKLTDRNCTIPSSYLPVGDYVIGIRSFAKDYDVSNTITVAFSTKDAADIPLINDAELEEDVINQYENLKFTVSTTTNADDVAIVYDLNDESKVLYATDYLTSEPVISGSKKLWYFSIPIQTASPERIFKLYASLNEEKGGNYKVVTATVLGDASIESIDYDISSPKVGDTIKFSVHANQYTDKVSLEVGGQEFITATDYVEHSYTREFTLPFAFQTAGLKTVDFFAWKDGEKNSDTSKSKNINIAENSNKLESVTIKAPYEGYSVIKGSNLALAWENTGDIIPDSYNIYLNSSFIASTTDTQYTLDASNYTNTGSYLLGINALKEGYTPSESYVTFNVIEGSISTTFNTESTTMAIGDTFTFAGKVTGKKMLEKVSAYLVDMADNSKISLAEKTRVFSTSFDLSNFSSFVLGEEYITKSGNYLICISAKEANGTEFEIASKPVIVSASNALVTNFEASTYDTYTGLDIKFTVAASNTNKVVFEADGYNIGTATGTDTFTLNYTGFNTPGTRTVWAYPCDSNGDAVRTNGKSVTIEVDSYGTIGQAKITYPTSANQVNTYEDLIIKWTGTNSNCRYNVTVYDPNDDKISSLTETTVNEFTIDGNELKTVGTYTISIYSVCDYYSPSYASATFYVTAENAIIEGFDNTPATRKIGDTIELEGTVKVDKGYIETITVNIWGPNTKSDGGTHRSISLSENLKSYDISNIDDIIVGQDPMDEVGKYWINVRVRTKGDNEAALVGTKEVEVVSENSIALNTPVITSSLDAVKDADYTLTWTDVDNANLYEIKIPDLGFKASVEKNIEYVKIPKKYLDSTGTYDIEIRAINTKDSSYQDGITSKELAVKETADVMRIIRIEYPETNTVPEGTNLKVKVITDDGRARLSRIGVRHVNNDLSYTWVSTFHAKTYLGEDIENALEWNIEIPVNLLENNRTLTLVLYDFLLIEKDTHDITFNCVENHNTMGSMEILWLNGEKLPDETDKPIYWNAPQGLPSAVDYYLADLTHNGETKRIYQNGKDKISGSEPSLTIPADMLSELGEYTLTITAYKEGFKKQSVSVSFTVKCSHHDKYVKEDTTLTRFGEIVNYGNSSTHKRNVNYYKRCEKCGKNDIWSRTEVKYESHNKKTGVKDCKFCACGYSEQGDYKAWRAYIQSKSDCFTYNLDGSTKWFIDNGAIIYVFGEYLDYYYVIYSSEDGDRDGFVKKNELGDSVYVAPYEIIINGKTIETVSSNTESGIVKYALLEDIINAMSPNAVITLNENSKIYAYVENTTYSKAYNIFADLTDCGIGTGKTLTITEVTDNNDIVYVYAYLDQQGKIYIEAEKLLYRLGGYKFDDTLSMYISGKGVSDIERIALDLVVTGASFVDANSQEKDLKDGLISISNMQYVYKVCKADIEGIFTTVDDNLIKPDQELKDVIIQSITQKALEDGYSEYINNIGDLFSELSPYIDVSFDLSEGYCNAFNVKNASKVQKFCEPIQRNLELFGKYCSVVDIINMGLEKATDLDVLLLNYNYSIQQLDKMIQNTKSDKMRSIYKEVRNDIYNKSYSSINKVVAGELALEGFAFATDKLVDAAKDTAIFKNITKTSSAKLGFAHTVTVILCGELLKGDDLYEAVANIELYERNRKLLLTEAKESYETYLLNPNKTNELLLKNSLYQLAATGVKEYEEIIKYQNSLILHGSAYNSNLNSIKRSKTKLEQYLKTLSN